MASNLRPKGYLARVGKEIRVLLDDPPEGVLAWPRDADARPSVADLDPHNNGSDSGSSTSPYAGLWIDACISPGSDTPYADGKFNLECCLSRDYPFVPPLVRFTTRIHHPNIDEQGRICIEILKEGTAPGRWKATSNLRMALAQIRQLLAEPNPDDPLVADTARELKADPALFRRRARAMTLQHAMQDVVQPVPPPPPPHLALMSSSSIALLDSAEVRAVSLTPPAIAAAAPGLAPAKKSTAATATATATAPAPNMAAVKATAPVSTVPKVPTAVKRVAEAPLAIVATETKRARLSDPAPTRLNDSAPTPTVRLSGIENAAAAATCKPTGRLFSFGSVARAKIGAAATSSTSGPARPLFGGAAAAAPKAALPFWKPAQK